MVKNQRSVTIASLLLGLSINTFACSNSGFTDAASEKSPVSAATDASRSQLSDKKSDSDASTANAADSSKSGVDLPPSDGLAIEGTAFTGDFEQSTPHDSTTVGCSLPPEVQKQMSAFVEVKPAAALALTGWGGGPSSQSQLGLKNLDLNNCEWFQKAKTESVARYMIVLTKGAQSYAQPFKLAANAITYAACITSAATASLSAGGPVSCSFMPRN